ncbi:hypothetical protein SAMD00019534_026590 [Acytostelium subglobosum LB1]|uniref:hypothetical protein n=1 Tax=Acytostelium subglobosum LB1 TaxID=1410327 RepID=UPI000644B46D|nr:hypothetical protein SAMD00019534_026590 [Acytostelium subglobosum LB1]GAM19484.1 hypothetical protein SAMD00019534_026590 [Acytostelium subglobosum LB1]|eukprot:XP_012757411.1 hypothetical protein SAMD00019534_026590 [Acytostelium subglobosum LB1]
MEAKTLNEQLEEREDPHFRSKQQEYDCATEILPYLYLAGEGACAPDNLKSLGVTLVINVAEECRSKVYHERDGINELKLPIMDRVGDEHQFDTFYKLFQHIDDIAQTKGKCIIHCKRGRSRSATIVIAYLMYKLNYTLNDAFHHVKERRKIIGPHYDLKLQLLHWERYLNKSATNTLDVAHFIGRDYS